MERSQVVLFVPSLAQHCSQYRHTAKCEHGAQRKAEAASNKIHNGSIQYNGALKPSERAPNGLIISTLFAGHVQLWVHRCAQQDMFVDFEPLRPFAGDFLPGSEQSIRSASDGAAFAHGATVQT